MLQKILIKGNKGQSCYGIFLIYYKSCQSCRDGTALSHFDKMWKLLLISAAAIDDNS